MTGARVPAPPWVGDAIPWAAGRRVQVLAERNGRPHVVLLPRRPGQATRVVAKHYADDAGVVAAGCMRRVRADLATLDDPALAVPDTAAWHGSVRVLELSAARGRPLLPVLKSTSWRHGLTAAARGLACLHTLPHGSGPITTMADHLDDLVHPAPTVAGMVMPELAERIAVAERTLRSWVWRDAPRAVPVHRDAHPRQMTLEGDRVWLVDWDVAARGDAALDVANFDVYLRTHLVNGEAMAHAFLDAYSTCGLDVSGRVPVYRALTYVRLVSKAARLRRPGWRLRAATFLARAERELASSNIEGAPAS